MWKGDANNRGGQARWKVTGTDSELFFLQEAAEVAETGTRKEGKTDRKVTFGDWAGEQKPGDGNFLTQGKTLWLVVGMKRAFDFSNRGLFRVNGTYPHG